MTPALSSARRESRAGAALTSFGAPAAAAFRSFAEAWRELAAPAHPFLQPEWFALTARFLVDGEALVVGARRDGDLIAALPLLRREHRLMSLSSAHTPRFDLVGDAQALPLLWNEIKAIPGWDLLSLDSVPATSPLAHALPDLAKRDGFRVAMGPGPRSPAFALDGFEEALPSKFGGNLRRRARKLGEIAFERIPVADDKALEEGFALEAAGWKGEANTAIACDPRTRRFYAALAKWAAARGLLALTFLRIGDRRIAFHFALEDGRAYYLLKPGFDPEFAASGPGQLLVLHAARDAAARGLSEFDFLGWEMEWKRPWMQTGREHLAIHIYRPSWRGRLLHTAREELRPRAAAFLRTLRGQA